MNRLTGLLHICNKAGKLIFGQKAVITSMAKGRLALVLLAFDAGSALTKKLSRCRTINIKISSGELGEVFQREKLSVLGIIDQGFADEFIRLLGKESLKVI